MSSDDEGRAVSEEYKRMWREFGPKNPHESRHVLQAVVDEARINAAEVNLLRQQVSNCYFENGVNHLEECQFIARAYMDRWKQFKHGRMRPGD